MPDQDPSQNQDLPTPAELARQFVNTQMEAYIDPPETVFNHLIGNLFCSAVGQLWGEAAHEQLDKSSFDKISSFIIETLNIIRAREDCNSISEETWEQKIREGNDLLVDILIDFERDQEAEELTKRMLSCLLANPSAG